MEFNLPSTIYAPEQLEAYLMELRAYEGWLRHQETKRRTKSKTAPADEPSLAAELVNLVAEVRGKKPVTLEIVEAIVARLSSILETAPTIYLMLPAVPNLKFKVQVVEWLRSNLNGQVLVSFRATSAVGGGVVVRTGSHIYDYSFRKQLWDNRAKLASLISGRQTVAKVEPKHV